MTDYGKPHRDALLSGEPERDSALDLLAVLAVFAGIFLILGFIGGVVAAANYLL